MINKEHAENPIKSRRKEIQNMKKIMLIALVLTGCLGTHLQSQNPCNLEKMDNKVKSLGNRCNVNLEAMGKQGTLYANVWGGSQIDFRFTRDSTSYFLILYFMAAKEPNFNLTESDTLYLSVAKGEVIKIHPCGKSYHDFSRSSSNITYSQGEQTLNNMAAGKPDPYGHMEISSSTYIYTGFYPLSKEQVKSLAGNDLEVFSLYFSVQKGDNAGDSKLAMEPGKDVKGAETDKDGRKFIKSKVSGIKQHFVKKFAACILRD